MAYDSQLRTLWAEPDDGIQLHQIYACLGYNKVDKNGNRNLGMVIVNGAINRWANRKPFRYGKWNFASDAERDAARKEMHQGLNIPTAANAGITSTMGKTYLGELAYRALSVAGTPNWEYLRPRGVTDIYNEPFRPHDFDGYNHLAVQPFDTKGSINNSGTMTLLPPAGETEIKVNRFVSTGLRFTLQMGVTNVDMSMEDLLYGSDADFYFLVAEKYVDTNLGEGTDYYERAPDEVLKAPTSIAEIPQHGGSSIIDYTLEANNDNKQIRFVVGINEYTSNADDADIQTRGYGFIAPYVLPSNIPFLYTIRQEFYGVFDMRYDRGFYLPNLNSAWQTYDLNVFDYVYKETDTDIVGISIKVRKRAVPYRIGSKNHSFSNAEINSKTGYKFELDTQNGVRVVAELTDETMTSSVQYVEIPVRGSSEDEWHTVYLKFPNALPSSGSQIASGLLRISTDNGATFTEISASSMGAGYIEAGCAGSSANIYQRRK